MDDTVLNKYLDRISGFWRNTIGVASALIIYAAALSSAGAISQNSPDAPGLGIVFFFLFALVCVFVHELGHAIAAVLAGWRVHVIVVSRVGYRPKLRKFLYVKGMFGGDYGGWVLSTPTPGRDWNKGWPLVVFGGPLSNLLMATLLISVAYMIPDDRWSGFCGGLGLASIIVGMANLLPIWRLGEPKSDGAHLLNAALGRDVNDARQRLSRALGFWFDGIPPKDWDPSVIAQIEADLPTSKNRMTCEWILVNSYFSHGDLWHARDLLEQSDATTTGRNENFVIAYACLIGWLDRDAERAAKLLDSVSVKMRKDSFHYWRAIAIVHGLRGEAIEARQAVELARCGAKKSGLPLDPDDDQLFVALENGKPPPEVAPRAVST